MVVPLFGFQVSCMADEIYLLRLDLMVRSLSQTDQTVAHFRALPNCMVWRPADGNETSAAYLIAMNAHCPSVMCFSRQNLPQLENSSIEKAAKGGYVVKEAAEGKKVDLTYVSTGSEVAIALEAANLLEKEGKTVRVVSLPCFEVFDMQPREYRLSVLPDGAPVLSVEAMSVSDDVHRRAHTERETRIGT